MNWPNLEFVPETRPALKAAAIWIGGDQIIIASVETAPPGLTAFGGFIVAALSSLPHVPRSPRQIVPDPIAAARCVATIHCELTKNGFVKTYQGKVCWG